MMCTCPKCHAKIELDLPEVTEAGSPAACPACNARFTVHRESFGGRALRKTSEISCASCGSELGPQMHCPNCGAQFPDYLVAGIGRKRARREGKKVKLKSNPFPQTQQASSQLPTLEMSMRPEAAKHAPAPSTGSKYPKPLVLGITLLVAVALIAAGSVFYLKHKAEKEYTKNFVRATYCIQTGTDKALKTSARVSAEWKAKLDTGQSYTARPGVEDEKDFNLVDTQLDQALQKLGKPPEKFASCNERITKLQAVYTKMRALILVPGNSLPAYLDTTAKLDSEYSQAIKEYKSGIPEELMKGLLNASLKYKGLRKLVK